MSLLKNFAHIQIPLEDVHSATNNFGAENFIRQGGFGKIYKGELFHHGKLIDIVARKLDEKFGQGDKEFWTEIWMLSNLKHQNLVNIIGFCNENNEKIIINKYEAKGSLDGYLSDPTLMWTQRLQICVDVARALRYIHYDEAREFSVVHRNIKSSKILLDDNWQPKLCGFNLSLKTRNSRRRRLILAPISGTFGYVDPKYAMSGCATHKSDVYSFGVVLFEVLCGRRSVMKTEGSELLAYLAKSHYEDGTLDNMIDQSLRKQMDPKSYKIFSETAYCCLKGERAQRPHIDQIVIALENALKLQLKRESDEHSMVVGEVEGRESDRWKGKNLDHLKIKLHDIEVATENFAEKYYIGSGGYGKVYKAELEHFENKNQISHRKRSTVALKCITKSVDKQGERGFIAEVETLSRCKHRNIVSLLGFCDDGQHMIIVYEFASNGSLEDYLENTGKMTNFTWVQRLNICLDIARGLDYLHTSLGDKLETIHRDMKSANILLNDKWEAMIADFGLSKSYQTNPLTSTINTNYIAGTPFYLDPHYKKTGRLKKASDIYSFGVILFEILCGRLAHDPIYTKEDANGLAPIARRHFEEKRTYEMVDPKLKEENDDNVFTKGLNQDSLDTFAKIAYQCVTEAQTERPKIEVVIEELNKALYAQKNSKSNLKISLEDVKLATQNFSGDNVIGRGGFGKVYHGEVTQANGCISIAAKRLDRQGDQGEHEFSTELEILLEYKHQNIIGLVGYCDEMDEKVIVYEYASRGNLQNHINSVDLTWIKRLEICIEVAIVLEFFHEVPETQDVVIHRDIKSGNILLMDDWKPKVTDFGLSLISSISQETDYVIENPCGTLGYVDPLYLNDGILTKGSDIYSFGVVLLEILSGNLIFRKIDGRFRNATHVLKCHYEEGRFDEMVFEGIKEQISPNARDTFLKLAYQCLNEMREQRPTAREVVLQLKKALDFQIDFETWEPKLAKDYKEIIERSYSPEIYSAAKKEDLYNIFSNGILLQPGNMILSFDGHGGRNELISATKFIYTNNSPHKWRSLRESRFHKVAEMLDISNLMIKMETKPQFLSLDVVYGVHLVFKFCKSRDCSSKPVYVNLKYKMGDETYHSYFATQRDQEWMMIELYRFLNQKDNVELTFLIESLSPFNHGDDDVIYVEGIEFRALNNVEHEEMNKVKEVHQVIEPKRKWQRILLTENEKLFSLSEVNGKKHLMLSAKAAFDSFSGSKLYESKPSSESRFQEIIEVLPQKVFYINCAIESQKLSREAEYMCFLVFKLSKESQGMYCAVKVRDLLHHENKEPEIIYLTNQKTWNSHDFTRVPKERGDGWMEVHVSKFDLNRELDQDDCLRVNLKFISYEGTMPGLIVNGLEFRPAQTRCTLGADDEEPLLKLVDDAEPMVDSVVADVAVDQGVDDEDRVADVPVVANVVGVTSVVVSDPVADIGGGADTVLS